MKGTSESGIIQMLIIIILAIVILSLLGISIKSLVDKLAANQFLGENFNYVWEGLKNFFNKYLGQYYFRVQDWVINFFKDAFWKVLNR